MVENQLSRFTSQWTLHAYGDEAQGEWIRMQDDGNAAIYTENGRVSLWCTRTDGGQDAPRDYWCSGHLL